MNVNNSLLAVLSMVLILLLFVSVASAADANATDVLSVDESVNLENNNTLALDASSNNAVSNDNNAVENDTWYVNASAAPGGDGKSPETAFKTLNDALTVAQDGNTIMIASGEYKRHGDNTGLSIDKNLNLIKYGDGEAIFDAEKLTNLLNFQATYINITGLTFKNGIAGYGGAIYFYSGGGSIINCIFTDNEARDCGGAIYERGYDDVNIVDSIFEGNTAFIDGGAIRSEGDVKIDNSTFSSNHAAGYGGAIYAEGMVKIDNSTFLNNYAYHGGGAIYAKDYVKSANSIFSGNSVYVDGGAIYAKGNVDIKNSTFENNKADGASVSQCYGGAIRSKGDVKIDNCSFLNNHAYDYGGAIYAETVTWVNTTSYFIGNYVDDNCGGAIYTNKFNTDIYYGVFINNTAKADDDGGAIYINEEYHGKIALCYFENNRCGDEGGAIYTDSMSSSLKLLNNIFIDNDAGDKGDIVYNSGYYDAIAFNWFGINNPNFDNKFKEYHAIGYDEDHSDGYPVHAKLLLDNDCEDGKEYNLTVYFEDGKGNHAILPCDLIDITISADNDANISDWHEVSECTYVTGITFANTGVTHITGQVNNYCFRAFFTTISMLHT